MPRAARNSRPASPAERPAERDPSLTQDQSADQIHDFAEQAPAAAPGAPPVGGSGHAQRALLHAQRVQGNAHVQRLLAQRRPDPAEELRARAGAATGYDLSEATIQPDSPLAAAAGVEALTVAQEVHVAPGQFQPETSHGAHVLLHELSHVAQQGSGAATIAAEPAGYELLESRADADAARAAQLAPDGGTRALAAPAPTIAQAFDPRYHRQSTVQGLAGSGFSADEIGQIYAANWERDFSQAHPALGNIVLAWKAVKLAAFKREPLDPKIEGFNSSVGVLTQLVPFHIDELMNQESYGGYRYYEHMDNPGGDPALQGKQGQVAREQLLSVPKGESIPQYLVDSREYIKAQLYKAAHAYRGDMGGTGASKVADAFGKRERELAKLVPGGTVSSAGKSSEAVAEEASIQSANTPQAVLPGGPQTEAFERQSGDAAGAEAGGDLATSGPAFHAEVDKRFWAQTHYKVNQRLDPKLPEDQPYIKIWLQIRDQVRAEREAARQKAQATPAPAAGGAPKPAVAGTWGPDVADGLGRAGHALEDFFAHSNFVELAIGQPATTTVADTDPASQTGFKQSNELGTGTFGKTDKIHALAHKMRAVSDEIEAEMPLVNRVAGRTTTDPTPDQVHIGNEAEPAHEEHEHEDEDSGPPSTWDWIKAAGGTGLHAAAKIIGYGTLGGAAAGGLIGARVGSMLGPLGALGGGVLGGLIGGAAGFFGSGGIEGMQKRIQEAARDIIATPEGVAMLRRVAELLEQMTRNDAQEGSHTKLAKDQGGHDDSPLGKLRTIKFELAQELAARADQMVLGKMREVFDAPTPEAADTLLQDIFGKLNGLIAAPTGHPLESVINKRRDQAIQALEEYQKHSQPGDFPASGGDSRAA